MKQLLCKSLLRFVANNLTDRHFDFIKIQCLDIKYEIGQVCSILNCQIYWYRSHFNLYIIRFYGSDHLRITQNMPM